MLSCVGGGHGCEVRRDLPELGYLVHVEGITCCNNNSKSCNNKRSGRPVEERCNNYKFPHEVGKGGKCHVG